MSSFVFFKGIYWLTVNVFDSIILKMLYLSKFIFSRMPLHVQLIIENWQQSYHLQPNFILNIVLHFYASISISNNAINYENNNNYYV